MKQQRIREKEAADIQQTDEEKVWQRLESAETRERERDTEFRAA